DPSPAGLVVDPVHRAHLGPPPRVVLDVRERGHDPLGLRRERPAVVEGERRGHPPIQPSRSSSVTLCATSPVTDSPSTSTTPARPAVTSSYSSTAGRRTVPRGSRWPRA